MPLLLAILLSAMLQGPDYSAPHPVPATPATSRTGPLCPWLTEGTAAAVLKGEVTAKVVVITPTQGSCTFAQVAPPFDHIRVDVGSKVFSCPDNSPAVIGVGTRADRCHSTPAFSQSQDTISGKLRQIGLAVTLLTHPSALKTIIPSSKTDAKNDSLQQLAEQVAGNLF